MVSLGARRCEVTALEDPLGHRQGHRVIHREPQLPRVLPGVQAGVQHLGGKDSGKRGKGGGGSH